MKKKVATKAARKQVKSSASKSVKKGQVKPSAAVTNRKPPPSKANQKQTPPCPPVNRGGLSAETREKISRAKRAPLFEKHFTTFRTLLVEQNLTVREIAKRKLIPVAYETMRKWSEREGLEAQRQSKIRGPQAMHANVLRAVEKLVQKLDEHVAAGNSPWKGAFDELGKGVSVLEKLSGDSYFPGHLSVTCELLVEYLRVSKQEDILSQLSELLPGFSVWALAARTR